MRPFNSSLILKQSLHGSGIAAMAALLLSGCGGGSGGGGSASSTQAKFATDLATIGTVNTYINSLSTLDRSDLANATLAYLKKNPSFVNPGISDDGTVYGTLQDGFPFAIETNDPTIDLQAGPAPTLKKALSLSKVRKVTKATAANGLPGGGEAFVIDGFPANCESPASTIAGELKDAGYHVTSSSGLLSDWKAVSNASVLFNSSHGARVPDPKTGALVFWQQSGQVPQQSDASWAKPLIDSGALMVDQIPDPSQPLSANKQQKAPMVFRYTFSAKYLTNAKMFAPNSIFWDECCSGTSSPGRLFAASLQQNNGLDLFAGWSQPVIILEGNETSSFFFDRALGLNLFPPVDTSMPPPNNWSSIFGIMQTTDRASVPTLLLSQSDPTAYASEKNSPVAIFTFINGAGSLSTIIPSISAVAQDTANKELTISGSFGSAQGTVNVGSSSVAVKSWTPTSITTQIPTVTGDVQVVSPYETLSNKVALPAAGGILTITISGLPQNGSNPADGTYTLQQATSQVWAHDGAYYVLSMNYDGYNSPVGAMAYQNVYAAFSGLPTTGPLPYVYGVQNQWALGPIGMNETNGSPLTQYGTPDSSSFDMTSVQTVGNIVTVGYKFTFTLGSISASGSGTFVYNSKSVIAY